MKVQLGRNEGYTGRRIQFPVPLGTYFMADRKDLSAEYLSLSLKYPPSPRKTNLPKHILLLPTGRQHVLNSMVQHIKELERNKLPTQTVLPLIKISEVLPQQTANLLELSPLSTIVKIKTGFQTCSYCHLEARS